MSHANTEKKYHKNACHLTRQYENMKIHILVLNALKLRTLFGLFNIYDSSVTDESFVDKTLVWHKYKNVAGI